MIDFSCPLNFIKPNVQIDFNTFTNNSNGSYKKLLSLLAKRYKLPKVQIELFNGYSSAIYSILKFLDLKYCFVYSPCDLEYKKAVINLGYEFRQINRFENIYLPIKEKSVVVFMNPSFLDGTYYELERLFSYWVSKEATIIVDESFLDFSNLKSKVDDLKKYENLYIIKDFSKYFSSASLNIASIFSNEVNMKRLRRYEPSSKVSIYELKYLEESLKDEKFKAISNSINIKNRIEIENTFFATGLVDIVYQSNSNSLLIKLKNDVDLKKLQKNFEKSSIRILDCKGIDFLDESYFNIYIKSKDSIEVLKRSLDAF